MAKQLGIHQIRGKVGERSYYKTKGVETGISRSINQGLSARVKTADEYANTRLNNAEFKTANAIATAAFNSVANRKNGMMRNFAIAQMTKKALSDIKMDDDVWGLRTPVTELDALICDMLENYAKSGKYDGEFGTIEVTPLTAQGAVAASITLSVELMTQLLAQGMDGVVVVPSKALAGTGEVDDAIRVFAGSAIGAPVSEVFGTGDPSTINITGSVGTPASVGMSQSGYTFAQEDEKHGFYLVLTFLPFRTVGSQRYLIQENCTFAALPLGQLPS